MNGRTRDAVARTSELIATILRDKTMPDFKFTGEISLTLHINGGSLNHITENEQTTAEKDDVVTATEGAWMAMRRETFATATGLLTTRLDDVFGERNFHGEITLHLPIIAGACKLCRISSRRVHKVHA